MNKLRGLQQLLLSSVMLLCSMHALAQNVANRVERFAALPDWTGIWVLDGAGGMIDIDGYPRGRNGLQEWDLMGFNAPYIPEVRERFTRELPAIMQRSGQITTQTWGYPLMMQSPTPLQFLITPEETLILNFYREARHIYTDGRALPDAADRWPVPWGESIGHWEGDTLVIETVSVKQPGMFNIKLPLLSENAHYTERLRKVAPNRIESEFTIVDPETLSAPWTVKLAYRRETSFDRMFHLDADNDRTSFDGGTLDLLPPE